jgi:signal transduction histidine kinase
VDIITVYFLYGLSFFSMGLAVMLEVGRSSNFEFARALRPLAGFGLIHGSHEWIEMFLLIHTHYGNEPAYETVIGPARVIVLAISFFFLLDFGARLIAGAARNTQWKLLGTIAAIWAGGLVWVFTTQPAQIVIVAADVYTRYALAIPGAALTAWGLVLQQRKFFQAGMKGFGRDVVIAAVAFGLYGGIGQLFSSPSSIFPSPYINSATFQAWFGFPIQLFRSVMACIAAVSMISSLRAFEEETRRQFESLRETQQAEREGLEELRAEMLRRTVRAQESERQRIARELHDELGQTLTAIGLGLRAIAGNVASKPARVLEQTHELQALVDGGFTGLQNLITGLHPPQLDDFGLMAALRWYCSEVKERYGLLVGLSSEGEENDLPVDKRVVLYRIVQEGVTNIIRHAGTDQAKIRIKHNDAGWVNVQIKDEGHGFDVDTTLKNPGHPPWGLLGMIERAALVGGKCRIVSQIGAGTLVEVKVPVDQEKSYANNDTPAPRG